jgi:hypothetical protein
MERTLPRTVDDSASLLVDLDEQPPGGPASRLPARVPLGARAVLTFLGQVNWTNAPRPQYATEELPFDSSVEVAAPVVPLGALAVRTFLDQVNWTNQAQVPRSQAAVAGRPPSLSQEFTVSKALTDFAWD